MDDFAVKMVSGLLLMTSGVAQWDESTAPKIEDLKAQLGVFVDACEYELELRNAALEAAGGADAKGDTDRARKVATPESAENYVENLKV